MFEYLRNNKDWIFSGIGILALTGLGQFIFYIIKTFINRKKRCVQIKVSFYQTFVSTILGTGPVYPNIGYEITNIGKEEVLIKSVSLDFCGKHITHLGYDKSMGLASEASLKIDKLLRPKEYFKGTFNISGLVEAIGKQLTNKAKMRIQAIDTLGNLYFSKKFKYSELLHNIEISNSVNTKG